MLINKTHILDQISLYKPSHIIIGYSGGIDSSVLLDICKNSDIPVIAIYINHNIHPDSLSWQEHCHKICDNYNIDFKYHSLAKMPKGESFEAWASKQRMAYFQNIMKDLPNPLLLLGHHQDDQAETFLIQAIRGSGLAGLAAMPNYKKLTYGALFRPLLDYTKQQIKDFAQQNNICYIFDDSNENSKYRRNLIRNEIIPILKQVNPSISQTLSRNANICAQSNNILTKLLLEKLNLVSQGTNIAIDKIIKLDADIQKSILHLWFKQNTQQSLKSKQLQDIYIAINNPNTGWQIDINKAYQVCINYNLLIIKTNAKNTQDITKKEIITWLKTNLDSQIDFNNIIIRDKKPDDRCSYPGRNKSNKLKILFQELQIPAAERYKAKVIELNGKIIAIYPFFICA